MGRKRLDGGRRVTLGLKVSERLAALLDEARGDVTRSAWLEAALREALAAAGARPLEGRRAAPARQRAGAAPVAEPSRRPRKALAESAAPCRHTRALKGWCNECKTGGHF